MPERPRPAPLAAPAVNPHEYDTAYYTGTCAGYEEWSTSNGQKMAGIYKWALGQVGVNAGETTLDIGTGRAEMVALCAAHGARVAMGIEYSPDAVPIARQTIAAHDVGDRAHVLLADARRLPFPPDCLDVVTMLDVVEHLTPGELALCLEEVARCLRPSGRLLVHTFPTSTIYDVTYRLQRNLLPWRRRTWPAQPRNDYELRMHVNEQTPRRLAGALRRAGLEPQTVSLGNWVYADHVPEKARRIYPRLAKHRLTAPLAVGNLWAIARPAA